MLIIPLISVKECVSFTNSRHLISYFILEWASLAKTVKSVQHMLELKYLWVRGSAVALLTQVLTADAPAPCQSQTVETD